MPNVRPASNKFESTCSKAPLAERYIKGKDMTTAAITARSVRDSKPPNKQLLATRLEIGETNSQIGKTKSIKVFLI